MPAGMSVCKGPLAEMSIVYRSMHRGIHKLLVVALSYFQLSQKYISKEDSLLPASAMAHKSPSPASAGSDYRGLQPLNSYSCGLLCGNGLVPCKDLLLVF